MKNDKLVACVMIHVIIIDLSSIVKDNPKVNINYTKIVSLKLTVYATSVVQDEACSFVQSCLIVQILTK